MTGISTEKLLNCFLCELFHLFCAQIALDHYCIGMKSKTCNKCTFDQGGIVMPSFTYMQCNVWKLKRESIMLKHVNVVLLLFSQVKHAWHIFTNIWTNNNHFKSYTQWGMYEASIIVYWERCCRTYFMELTRSDSACVINRCVLCECGEMMKKSCVWLSCDTAKGSYAF